MLLLAAGVLPLSHTWLVLLLLLSVVANEVYGQLVRGLGLNRFFAGMGLATAVLIVVLSVALVGWLGMGIAGIFIANAVARLLPVLVVELWHRPVMKLLSASVDWRPTARELLRYTLPLIPTVVIWWVLSFGDGWFVLWVAGTDANGVYAVAARFTGAIYAFTLVLQQAWQESAILQYGSDDRNTFFSQILAVFIYISCLIVMVYLAALHLSYGWLVESNYAGSEAYLFPMAVSAVIFSLASFLEMGYQFSRDAWCVAVERAHRSVECDSQPVAGSEAGRLGRDCIIAGVVHVLCGLPLCGHAPLLRFAPWLADTCASGDDPCSGRGRMCGVVCLGLCVCGHRFDRCHTGIAPAFFI